jgi:hypothetical protein
MGAALNQVPGKATPSQPVVIIPGPAKFMHQRRQHQSAVGNTPGNHNIGTRFQRGHQTRRAQVSIEADHHAGQGVACAHFGNARFRNLLLFWQQIVTQHQRNLQVQPLLITKRLQSVPASLGIDTTGVTQHLDVLAFNIAKQRPHDSFHEIPGIPVAGIFHALARHDGHGDFGQIIRHQVIQIALLNQLPGRRFRVAPKGSRAADSDGFFRITHGAFSPQLLR